jgi:hypothetical protein
MTTIERLKVKLGHSEDDNLLEVYLDDAKYEFLSYTGRKDIPKAAMGVIEDMVIAKYNQRGNEGLASQSYSGISESYQTTYSDTTKTSLNRWRKLRTL